MTTLVTGAAGFLGGHVAELLLDVPPAAVGARA